MGTYRGDKSKWFPTNCVRFLTQDELLYIKEVVSVGITNLLQLDELFYVMSLQHTDNLDEQQKRTADVYIIDFTKKNLSISKHIICTM